MSSDAIAIVGASLRCAGGNDVHEVRDSLMCGRNSIELLKNSTRDDFYETRKRYPDVRAGIVDGVEMFDNDFFKISEKEAMTMDPQQRILLEAVVHALEESGIPRTALAKSKASVFTAAWAYGYFDRVERNKYAAGGNSAAVMCGRISHFLNSRGASIAYDSACSSTLVAVHEAHKAILRKQSDLVIVAGAGLISEKEFLTTAEADLIRKNGFLRAFDCDATGYVRGEAFGAIILCSTEYAAAHGLRTRFNVLNTASNNDGQTGSLFAPNPVAQIELHQAALGGNLKYSDIDLIVCHGTGTQIGDQVEVGAVNNKFPPETRIIGSKSNFAHAEAACALITLFCGMFAIEQSYLPPQLHLSIPIETARKRNLPFVGEEASIKRVLVNSFGFGGTNACAILERVEKNESEEPTPESSKVTFPRALLLSAKTEASLKRHILDVAEYLENTCEPLSDVLDTFNNRRTHDPFRVAITGNSHQKLASKLRKGDYTITQAKPNSGFQLKLASNVSEIRKYSTLLAIPQYRENIDNLLAVAAKQGILGVEAVVKNMSCPSIDTKPLQQHVAELVISKAVVDLLHSEGLTPKLVEASGVAFIYGMVTAGSLTFENAVRLLIAIDRNSFAKDFKTTSFAPPKTSLKYANATILKKIDPKLAYETILAIDKEKPLELVKFSLDNYANRNPTGNITEDLETLICAAFAAGVGKTSNATEKVVSAPYYSFEKKRFWSPENNQPKKVKIGIRAMSCRLPGGTSSPSELWDLLVTGRNPSSRFPASRIPTRDVLLLGKKYGNAVEGANFITQDVKMFDNEFFRISKTEVEMLDPLHRIAFECVEEALENAGITDYSRLGFYLAMMEKEYSDLLERKDSLSSLVGSQYAFLSGRLNYIYGSQGPSMTVDTACSSSLVAMDAAIAAIACGRIEQAVVAGTNIMMSEHGAGVRANGRMSSLVGVSRCFDAAANGYGRGDGCSAVILEKYRDDAPYEYLATIEDVDVNHGGRAPTMTTPNGEAQKVLLKSVFGKGDYVPRLGYWELHGTGTPVGDPIETGAIAEVIDKKEFHVGSIKALIGHGEAASGTNSLIKVVKVLGSDYVPAQIHLQALNPKIVTNGNIIFPFVGAEKPIEVAGSSSFGLSGTNAAVVLSKAANLETLESARKYYVIPISAKNADSAAMMEKEALELLESSDESLLDIASAFSCSRLHYLHRKAIVCDRSGRIVGNFSTAKKPTVGKASIHVSGSLRTFEFLSNPCVKEIFQKVDTDGSNRFESITVAVISMLTELTSAPITISKKASSFAKLLEDRITSATNTEAETSKNAIELHINDKILPISDEKTLAIAIGELYISGMEMNWERLYKHPNRNVNISTYAFNKQLLWHKNEAPVFEHYLLGTVASPEHDGSTTYQNQLMQIRHPHLFNGDEVNLGTMLEIVQAAMNQKGVDQYQIPDLTVQRVKPKNGAWLKTTLKKNSAGFEVSATIDSERLFECQVVARKSQPKQHQLPDQIKGTTVFVKNAPNTVVTKHSDGFLKVDASYEQSKLWAAVQAISSGKKLRFRNITVSNKIPDVFWICQQGNAYAIIGQDGVELLNFECDEITSITSANQLQPQKTAISSKAPPTSAGRRLTNGLQKQNSLPASHEPILHKSEHAKQANGIIVTTKSSSEHEYSHGYILDLETNDTSFIFDYSATISKDGLTFTNKQDTTTDVKSLISGAEKKIKMILDIPNLALAPDNLFKSFLDFSKEIVKNSVSVELEIGEARTMGNETARAFFKCLAAEKPNLLNYRGTRKMTRLSNESITKRVSEKVGGTWMITGGLGGIGFAIAEWLAKSEQAKGLVLVSRRTPDAAMESKLAELRKFCPVTIISADCSDYTKLKAALEVVPVKITGFIHCAGVLADAMMERQSMLGFQRVFNSKGVSMDVCERVLNELHHPLDHFIVMSSMTAGVGNRGQLNYGFSNAYLDYRVLERRAKGLPGTSIQWGNWNEAGMAVKVNDILQKQGFVGITNEEGLAHLMYAMLEKPEKILVANFDWAQIVKSRPELPMDAIVLEARASGKDINSSNGLSHGYIMSLETDTPGAIFSYAMNVTTEGIRLTDNDKKVYDLNTFSPASGKPISIFVNIPNSEIEPEALFRQFLDFAKALVRGKIQTEISVSQTRTLGNETARAFFKSLAAEKYPLIKYRGTRTMTRLSNDTVNKRNGEKIGGTWFITGGLGGIGLAVAEWLVKCENAKGVVLASRRQPDEETEKKLSELRKICPVETVAVDCSNYEQLKTALATTHIKISGFIHCAGVLADAMLERQSMVGFQKVFTSKGTSLDACEKVLTELNHPIKHFIVMSSFTAGLGNKGQLNYGFSNAYIDYRVLDRRSTGLPGTSIQWGNWNEAGMAVKVHEILEKQGLPGLSNAEGLRHLKYAILEQPEKIVVANMEWEKIAKSRPDLPADAIVVEEQSKKNQESSNSFQHTISDAEIVPISDHLLQGVPIVPATYSLYMLAKHQQKISDTNSCALSQVRFKDKWDLQESRTCVSTQTNGTWSVSCNAKLKMTANIRLPVAASNKFVRSEFDACTEPLSEAELYAKSKENGLYYGPQFALNHNMMSDKALTYSVSKLKPSNFVPAVLDAAIHAVVGCLFKKHPDFNYLPISFGTVYFNDIDRAINARPGSLTVYSRIDNDTDRFTESSCWLFHGNELIFEVTGLIALVTNMAAAKQSTTKPNKEKKVEDSSSEGPGSSITAAMKSSPPRSPPTNGSEAQTYSLSESEFGAISHHLVNEAIVVPGAFQMLKLAQHAAAKSNSAISVLKTIRLREAWFPEESHEYRIVETNGTKLELECCGKKKTTAEISRPIATSKIDREKFQAACTEKGDPKHFYETLAANGLKFKNAFQRIEEIRLSDTKATAKISPSPHLFTLVDGAMQTANYCMIRKQPDSYWIPIGLREVYFDLSIKNYSSSTNISAYSEITSRDDRLVQLSVWLFVDDKLLFAATQFTGIVGHRNKEIFHSPHQTRRPSSTSERPNSALNGSDHRSARSVTATNSHTASSKEPHQQNVNNVYVAAMDCHAPYGSGDIAHFWQNIKSMKIYHDNEQHRSVTPGVANIDLDLKQWDPEFFRISPKEAPFVDPMQRQLLMSVQRALTASNCDVVPNTGIFVGACNSDFYSRNYAENESSGAYYSTGAHNSCLAGRLSHWLKAEGPAMTIDTACSSSMAALCMACDAIRIGRCEMAIVCGVNIILHDGATEVLERAQMLSKSGFCRSFDAGADGYSRAEGICTLILTKNRPNANKILSIPSWTIGHNGTSAALPVPSGPAQIRSMKEVLSEKSMDVAWVECHCTGTPLGDPIETTSVANVLPNARVSSIKGLLGHGESVAGLFSFFSAALQLLHNFGISQPHVGCVNPKIPPTLGINHVGSEVEADRVLVNNFGFSGTNTSALLTVETEQAAKKPIQLFYLVPVSVRTKDQLPAAVTEVTEFVEQSSMDLADIAANYCRRKTNRFRSLLIFDYKRKLVFASSTENGTNLPKLMNSRFDALSGQRLRTICGSDFGLKNRFAKEDLHLFCKNNFSAIRQLSDATTVKEFISRLEAAFTSGQTVDWSKFCKQGISMELDANVPKHLMNNDTYWNQGVETASTWTRFPKRIFYEKKLVQKERPKVFNNNKIYELDTGMIPGSVRISETSPISPDCTVIYCPQGETSADAMKLVRLWIRLAETRNAAVVVACKNNGTTFMEWTGLLKSFAAERLLPFKFISYENLPELVDELKCVDDFETIFYRKGIRFVERIVEVSLDEVPRKRMQNLLITGGTGGVGSKFINFFKPLQSTVVTREPRPASGRSKFLSFAQVEGLHQTKTFDFVAHFAGTVQNRPMAAQSEDAFENILDSKIRLWDKIWAMSSVDGATEAIAASSANVVLGSAGQANYVFANGLMASRCEKRANATVVFLGAIGDVGMLSSDMLAGIRQQIENNGWNFLNSHNILPAFFTNKKSIMVFQGNWSVILQKHPYLSKYLSEILRADEKTASTTPEIPTNIPASTTSQVEDRTALVASDPRKPLTAVIHEITGIKGLEMEKDTPLMNLGIDSLMIEEIRTAIAKTYGVRISAADVYDNSTMNNLEKYIKNKSSSTVPLKEMEPKHDTNKSGNSPISNLSQSLTKEAPHPKVKPTVSQPVVLTEPVVHKGDSICVIGMSGAFSGSNSTSELWEALKKGEDLIERGENEGTFIRAFGRVANIDKFDHAFWKLTLEDASRLDPQVRVLLQHAYSALENSGYVRQRSKKRIGIWACAEPSEYYSDFSSEPPGSMGRLFRQNMKDFSATSIAHSLNLHGPAIQVYSACSSALIALDQASSALKLGTVDIAIVGAVSLVLPEDEGYEFLPGQVMSQQGYCKPFDVTADGIVRGSAVGCIVLRRLDDALKARDRILGIVKAIGVSNDGSEKASFMAPNSSGQIECMQKAVEQLNVKDIARIQFVECHGTGTAVGDEIELKALDSVYGKNSALSLGSIKANIGHGFAAAGLAGLVKTINILASGQIPPQAHFTSFGDRQTPFKINTELTDLQPGALVGLSSFGIGGTNAHVILEQPPQTVSADETESPLPGQLIVVSGKTDTACSANARAIAQYLRDNPSTSLSEVAATLQQKHDHFGFRIAFIAKTVDEAITRLESANPKQAVGVTNYNVGFFFSPQGIQYKNMEAHFTKFPCAFQETVDRLCSYASEEYGFDFKEVLYSDDKTDNRIGQVALAQVSIFIGSMAIARQLGEWGIEADTLVGHSVGEYAAAVYAGMMDERAMIRFLKRRGELIATTSSAKMIAIRGNYRDLPHILHDCEINSIVSDKMYVITGNATQIAALMDRLKAEQIEFRELETERGFHSSMMAVIEDDFRAELDKVTWVDSENKRILSCIDGLPKKSLSTEYCMTHLRRSVRLDLASKAIDEQKNLKVMIQIGPSGVLETLIRDASLDIKAVNTALPKRRAMANPNNSQMMVVLAEMWALGYDVNFEKIFPHKNFVLDLPGYQFDPIVCWRPRTTVQSQNNKFYAPCFSQVESNAPILELSGKKIALICDPDDAHCTILTKQLQAEGSTIVHFKLEKANEIDETFNQIVYIPRETSATDYSHFLVSKDVCFNNKLSSTARFSVLTSSTSQEIMMMLGPIREANLLKQNFARLIEVAHPSENFRALKEFGSSPEEYVLMSSRKALQFDYVECARESPVDIGHTVLILGASGSIGKVYLETFQAMKSVSTIYATYSSRKPDMTNENVRWIQVDVLSKDSIKSCLQTILSECGSLNSIVFTSGRTTASHLTKTLEDLKHVLEIKVIGVNNVLEEISAQGIKLSSLILTSSLSSFLALNGNYDYAAANLYLDYLAINGHPNIGKIQAVQWPAWTESDMVKNSAGQIKEFLIKNGISNTEGRKAIKESLKYSGCIAYAQMQPWRLRQILSEAQLQSREQQAIATSTGSSGGSVGKLTAREIVDNSWREIFGIKIHESSNFFELGGNSLNGLQVAWRVNELLGLNLNVNILFEYPIFGDFVKFVEQQTSRSTSTEAKSLDIFKPIPLSHAQEHMFILRQIDPTPKYNIVFENTLSKFTPEFSIVNYQRSIHSTIARQHSMRSIFGRRAKTSEDDSEYYQEVLSLTEAYQNLAAKDISRTDLLQQHEAEKLIHFDLTTVPLRVQCFKVGNEYKVLFNQHHIITDGWSMTVLANEFINAYKLYNSGRENEIVPMSQSPSLFAIRQERDLSEKLGELKEILKNRTPTKLCPAASELRDPVFTKIGRYLPTSLTKKLSSVARQHKISEFNVLLAKFMQTIRKWKADPDDDAITIGIPVSGRNEHSQDLIGYFLNNMILHAELKPNMTSSEALQECNKALNVAHKFETVPFHRVVSELKIPRNQYEHPIFDIYFNYRNKLDFPTVATPGCETTVEHVSMNKVFNFSVTVDETPDGTRILAEFNGAMYDTTMVNEFLNDLMSIVADKPNEIFVATAVKSDIPRRSLSTVLQKQQLLTPSATALEKDSVALPYNELRNKLQSNARVIENEFVKTCGSTIRGDDVITVTCGLQESVIPILSVLYAGAAYAPVDPTWPDERKTLIYRNSKTVINIDEMFANTKLKKTISTRTSRILGKHCHNNIAYVIHTSGSTGTPKGVAVGNANVTTFLKSSIDQTFMRPHLKVVNSVNTVFDVSVMNIFGTLTSGGRLQCVANLSSIPDFIEKNGTQFAFMTSAMFNALTKTDMQKLDKLENITIGGESILDDKLELAQNLGIDVTQIYGPTEATVWSLIKRCGIEENIGSNIGHPVANECCYLESGTLEGELILCGSKVARGYIGDPTSSKFFIRNGQKCYRTGDSVKLKNGEYYFVGRKDGQVKINGQRIETAEVSRAIMKVASELTTAIVQKCDESLVAFLALPEIKESANVEQRLLEKLPGMLPKYSIPSYFLFMEQLPQTRSGKIDKAVLTELFNNHKETTQTTARQSELMSSYEQEVAGIVTKLLGIQEVGKEDDFFALGGHSLLVFQLREQLESRFGLPIEVHEIFGNPKISGIAKVISKKVKNSLAKETTEFTDMIVPIKEDDNAEYNIYIVHAVGGTIYPYYSFMHIFDKKKVSLYGIAYNMSLPCETLKELSALYAKAVAIHTGDLRPFVMGQSLGGVIAREMVPDLEMFGFQIPRVVMFDSWLMAPFVVDIELLRNYALEMFSILPNSEEHAAACVKLAVMMERHNYTMSNIPLTLFKSQEIGAAEIRQSISTKLVEERLFYNGIDRYTDVDIDVIMIPGDHDSCLRLENLRAVQQEILEQFP